MNFVWKRKSFTRGFVITWKVLSSVRRWAKSVCSLNLTLVSSMLIHFSQIYWARRSYLHKLSLVVDVDLQVACCLRLKCLLNSMVRNQSRDYHSYLLCPVLILLLSVPSHSFKRETTEREREKKFINKTFHNLLFALPWDDETYLLASSTTVASINSVDLSLTMTWQSSSPTSGDLLTLIMKKISTLQLIGMTYKVNLIFYNL